VEKNSQKLCATSVIFKTLPKVSNLPNGEISPNLVTLDSSKGIICILEAFESSVAGS
jgi:hypothetical protein